MTQLSFNGLLEREKTGWLEETRQLLIKELRAGKPFVTSDDAWRLNPLPTYLHKNTVGKLFDTRFTTVGFTISRRKEAKGRTIRQWKLRTN